MSSGTAKPIPEWLSISVGGHFGPSFTVEFDGGQSVKYTHTKRRQRLPWGPRSPEQWETRSEELTPSPECWAAFRAALDELNVWCWQPKYFEPVCDGTGWTAEIVYPDKAVRSHGSNCFPGLKGEPVSIVDRTDGDTFEQFCRAVSALAKKTFR